MKQFHQNQKGSVMIITALSMVVLIAMAGLSLDLGKLFVSRSQIQNAADACALAAAQQLNGTSKQFSLAETAGIAAGTAAGNAKVSFVTTKISIPAGSAIRFLKDLKDSGISATAGTALNNTNAAAYDVVSCTVTQANISNWLIKVLNTTATKATQSVSAKAYASLVPAQDACALPIAVCSTASGLNSTGSLLRGQLNKNTNNNTYAANAYDFNTSATNKDLRWIHYGNGNGSATELNTLLSGANTCNLTPTGQRVITQPTPNNTLHANYNSRFGLKNGVTATPDYTGFAFYSSSSFATYQAEKNINAPYQYTVTQPTGYTNSTQATLAATGANRRVGIVPIVNCNSVAGGTTASDWACVMMSNPIVFNTSGNDDEGNENADGEGGRDNENNGNGSPGANNPGLVLLEFLGKTNKNTPCNQAGFAGAPAANANSVGFRVPALVK